MKKFRLIVIFFSIALIVVILFFIDFQNFISRSNLGSFLGIMAMVFNIVSMILSNRYETKNKKIKNE